MPLPEPPKTSLSMGHFLLKKRSVFIVTRKSSQKKCDSLPFSLQLWYTWTDKLFHTFHTREEACMKILAVDYGDSRTGLATCDRTEFLTTAITPQITLKARNKVAARVCEVAKEIGAELIVIGLPLNMDGTCLLYTSAQQDSRLRQRSLPAAVLPGHCGPCAAARSAGRKKPSPFG